MTPELVWLVIAAVLALVELIFGAFAAFCPAIGAIIASIVAACGLGLEGQLIAMVVGGAVSFMFLGPLVNKHRANGLQYMSKLDALIGRTAHVERPYDGKATYGRIKIDGDSWQIVNADRSVALDRGRLVKVVGYDSIVLTVRPVDE
ncbi:MAG: NfeD family protein [Muribaculum sp.]|nr:NfeD family protein [Muribaculum sp.]